MIPFKPNHQSTPKKKSLIIYLFNFFGNFLFLLFGKIDSEKKFFSLCKKQIEKNKFSKGLSRANGKRDSHSLVNVNINIYDNKFSFKLRYFESYLK